MARKTMPFGFARGYQAQVPAPLSGMTKTNTGYSEVNEYGNGGASVTDSAAKHAVFGMSFSGDASELEGIDIFNEFASGLYGRGLLHFSDPMNYDRNLMAPHWATPHLAELGWKNPIVGTPTYSDFVPNAYVPYYRQANYALSMAANAVPTHASKIQTILIPPTHKLWMGFKGIATGSAVVRVQPISRGVGTPKPYIGNTLDASLINPASSGQLQPTNGLQFDGATYCAVEIYVTRTSDAAADVSTLTLNASTARLFPRTVTPVLTGRHIAGKGHTGVRFGDAAIPETYKMVRGHKKQLSTTLVEVGAWL